MKRVLVPIAASMILTACQSKGVPRELMQGILRAEDTRDSRLAVELAAAADAATRERALLAVGRIGAPTDAGVLREALDHPVASTRAAAAFAIGELLDKDSLAEFGQGPSIAVTPALTPLLDPSQPRYDAEVAARAAEALGKIRDASAVGDLVAALEAELSKTGAPDNLLRESLAVALMRLRAPEATPVLLRLAASADDESRATALVCLRRIGAKDARQAALDSLKSASPRVRMEAAALLGMAGTTEDIAALAPALSDADHGVRVAAIRTIGRLGGERAEAALSPPFYQLARDADSQRDLAVTRPLDATLLIEYLDALEEIAVTESAYATIEKLRQRDDAIGRRALAACAQIAGRIGKGEDLASLLLDEAGVPMAPTREMLLAFPDLRTTETLLPVLENLIGRIHVDREADKDGYGRAVATIDTFATLTADDPGRRRDALMPLMSSTDPGVRAHVAAAFVRPEGSEAPMDPDVLKEFLDAYGADTEPSSEARLAIIDAVASYKGDPQTRYLLEMALKDPAREVRLAAIRGLGGYSREEAVAAAGLRAGAQGRPKGQSPERYYADLADLAGEPLTAIFEVENHDPFAVRLDTTGATITTHNFATLARAGYYDGIVFHRVIANFVAQGGDPLGNGEGGPGWAIPCEINTNRFRAGTMGMALSGKDTGGSQFFLCHVPLPHLDGGYTVFGQFVADSAGVPFLWRDRVRTDVGLLTEILPGDRIRKITIVED